MSKNSSFFIEPFTFQLWFLKIILLIILFKNIIF